MLHYVLFIIILILIYFKIEFNYEYWKQRDVPYIKPIPIFGNMKNFLFGIKSAPEAIYEVYNSIENVRYIGTYIFLSPMLLIKDLNLIKEIFVKEFDSFINRNYVAINEENEPVFGRCLFFLRGKKWRDMRSALSPAFTSSKMRLMYNLIKDCAENLVNHFEKTIDMDDILKLEMRDLTTRYATDVINSCAFGLKIDSFKEKNNEHFRLGQRTMYLTSGQGLKFFGYLLSGKLINILNIKLFNDADNNYYRSLVNSSMEFREQNNIYRPDMIHLLMELKKGKLNHEDESKNCDAGYAIVEESEVGKKQLEKTDFLDDDLVAQSILFFAAGFETTSTLLSFMAHELVVNKDIQKKLQNEIDETIASCDGELTYEIIAKMKYLDMVISECLRFRPPVLAIDRLCNKPYKIESVKPTESPVLIEKGNIVWISIFAIHMDANYWPEPFKFDPERFSDENKKNIIPFSYLPFGLGPRNCLGSRLALLETKAFFVYLLSKFELVFTEKTQHPIKYRKRLFGMSSEKGFWMGLKKRIN